MLLTTENTPLSVSASKMANAPRYFAFAILYTQVDRIQPIARLMLTLFCIVCTRTEARTPFSRNCSTYPPSSSWVTLDARF